MSKATTTADGKIASDLADVNNLLARAEKGDVSTLPTLRAMLEYPALVGLVDLLGNAARVAERSFIDAMCGDNLAFKEGLTRKLELLRAELAGTKPTPIERLLVERVVACWLQVQDADVRYAEAKDLTIAWAEYCQRRMDRAHRRYLSAVKTLALIRKLRGLAFDVPQVPDATARPATMLPLVRRAANAPADDELPGG